MSNSRTFVVFKPDAIERRLVGEILSRFEAHELTITKITTVKATAELLAEHYDEHVDEDYYEGLVEYMQEGPVIACVLEGDDAVQVVRDELLGETDPVDSDEGTIRGDFGKDSFEEADADNRAVRNLVHASATAEEARHEINLWFSQ